MILYLALAPARLGEHDDEDFPYQPYLCQYAKKEFEIHDRPRVTVKNNAPDGKKKPKNDVEM